MRNLRDRVAVVTGAANGIGYGLAHRFLAEGMKVVISDVNREDLERARVTLAESGSEVVAVHADVADAGSVEELASAALDAFGAVHVLCNNAGVGGFQRFSTTDLATWRWTLGVNLWGVIHGCHYFLPILAAQDEAYIVNTSSMAGFLTGPYMHPYNVSKEGVVALSESLSAEFSTEHPNVKVAALCPAFTRTAIGNDERNAPAGHVPRAEADPATSEVREWFRTTMAEEGISVDVVADLVVRGMAEGKTHIFPHPDWLDQWQQRVDTVRAQI